MRVLVLHLLGTAWHWPGLLQSNRAWPWSRKIWLERSWCPRGTMGLAVTVWRSGSKPKRFQQKTRTCCRIGSIEVSMRPRFMHPETGKAWSGQFGQMTISPGDMSNARNWRSVQEMHSMALMNWPVLQSDRHRSLARPSSQSRMRLAPRMHAYSRWTCWVCCQSELVRWIEARHWLVITQEFASKAAS